MDGSEAVVEEFAGFEKMMKIGAGVLGASGTVAGGVNGIFIQLELTLADVNIFRFGIRVVKLAAAGKSGRSHTVEHVRPGFDDSNGVAGPDAYTHGIKGDILRK